MLKGIKSNKPIIVGLTSFIALDLLSLIGWQISWISSVITVLLILIWLLVAQKNLALAVVLLIAELVVGSFGHLTQISVYDTQISLRLGLFIVSFGVMFYNICIDRKHIIFSHPWRWWYVGAIASLLWAVGVGYYNWVSLDKLVLDVNGYLYILLLPLFLQIFEEYENGEIIRLAKLVLVPAIIWLSLRTIFLLYTFTHFDIEAITWLYKWYRDTGLGEITPAGAGFFRIFSQSHIYSAVASVLGFAWLWKEIDDKNYKFWRQSWLPIFVVVFMCLIASMSRSLWLGVASSWLLVPLLSPLTRYRTYLIYLVISFVLVIISAGAVLETSRVTWPIKPQADKTAQVFSSRFNVEPAGMSRLKLLPPLLQAINISPIYGSGFGSSVTYYSADPRLINSSAGGTGLTTTSAFEWGYLDLWLKFGLLGMALYLMWLIRPLLFGLQLWHRHNMTGAAALALSAVFITNITTPYLNHPLGLGIIMFLGSLIMSQNREYERSS